MSGNLYNMLFGVEPTAHIVLILLGTTPDKIPRFRDAYLTWDDPSELVPVMVIHTRTGGGNRDDYERRRNESAEDRPMNDDLRKLPGFIRDMDSKYASTYANFYYEVPMEMRAQAIGYLRQTGKPLTPEEKFAETMRKLRETGKT